MKWMKQAFAVEFNKADGRTGHIWVDRYWSRILEGEPLEENPEAGAAEPAEARPTTRGKRGKSPVFHSFHPFRAATAPAKRPFPRSRAVFTPLRLNPRPSHRHHPPAII
jgi:hypothetical protein